MQVNRNLIALLALACANCGSGVPDMSNRNATTAGGSGGTTASAGVTSSAGTGGASGTAATASGRGGASSAGSGGAYSPAGMSGASGMSGGMSGAAAGGSSGGSGSGSGGDSAAGIGGAAGGAPEMGTAEDSGADCAVPELPAASQLTAFAKHHDPFTKLDGTRIAQKSEWRCRRAEIKAQLERYEAGPKPVVAPEDVSARFSGNALSITVNAGGKSVTFSVNISRPASAGSEAIPLVINFGFATLDDSVFSQSGVATTVLDVSAMGAQSGGGSRGTGRFFELYGRDHAASSMIAWAWAVSRIVDAVEKTPDAKIDPRRIAVTGCSRYGKGALLAGALDERIVLTIPQESGAGGSASWRVSQAQSQMGENVQTLSSAAGEQPWFRADFGTNFGGSNVTKLPFDHHMVMGLVAPRALLVIDNQIDWLGIDSSYTAGSIAHTIWKALGLADHMGYWQTTGHTHCQFPSQQRAILDAYVKKFLVGSGTGDTTMLRADAAEADLDYWMEWAPPTLQ